MPVSAVIATRDRPDALQACLAAIQAGDRHPAEIIVIDQSSTDATGLVCRAAALATVPVIHVRDTPRGMSAAQNEGFRRASQPIIAVTDDDCVPALDWISTGAQLLRERADLGGLTGRILPLPANDTRRFPVATRVSTIPEEFRGRVMPWQVGSGNNVMVRHELLQRIGGCDERLGPGAIGRGGADMDLFARLLQTGTTLRYDPKLLVYHERQTYAGRRARREPYGFGMGACCGIYVRQRDAFAIPMFAAWLRFRAGRGIGGLRDRNAAALAEELLILRGTLAGLWFGLRQRPESGPQPQRTAHHDGYGAHEVTE